MTDLGAKYSGTRGTAIDMAALRFGIPAAAIELPANPDVLPSRPLVRSLTFGDLRFIVADPKSPGNVRAPDFDRQRRVAKDGIDAERDGAEAITFRDAGALQSKAKDQVSLELDGDPRSVAVFDQSKRDFDPYEDGETDKRNAGGKDRTRLGFLVDNARPLVIAVQ